MSGAFPSAINTCSSARRSANEDGNTSSGGWRKATRWGMCRPHIEGGMRQSHIAATRAPQRANLPHRQPTGWKGTLPTCDHETREYEARPSPALALAWCQKYLHATPVRAGRSTLDIMIVGGDKEEKWMLRRSASQEHAPRAAVGSTKAAPIVCTSGELAGGARAGSAWRQRLSALPSLPRMGPDVHLRNPKRIELHRHNCIISNPATPKKVHRSHTFHDNGPTRGSCAGRSISAGI